jgi:hypothetical protein
MRPDHTDPGTGVSPRDHRISTLPRGGTEDDVRREPRDRAGGLRDGDQGDLVDTATARIDGTCAGSWQDIKGQFVDDPAGALAAAERLVQMAVDVRVRALQDEAAAIRARGDDDDSTEALRTRLIRYQEYCERMASDTLH